MPQFRKSLIEFFLILIPPVMFVSFVGFWVAQNTFFPTTQIKSITLDKETYHAGEIVTVHNVLVRYRSCMLYITRVLERPDDHREFIIQNLHQLITADNPPFDRDWVYTIQIPPELPPGQYIIYSRIQYYCNFMDYVFRRSIVSPASKLTVVKP